MARPGQPTEGARRRSTQSPHQPQWHTVTAAELEGVFHMAVSRARFLTPREVADLLRVSSMTVYRLIKSGELRAARVGKAYRILEDDVDAYLAGRFTQAG
jgi:excisionase family DNA binding protein